MFEVNGSRKYLVPSGEKIIELGVRLLYQSGVYSMLLKVEGLKSIVRAMDLLSAGEHIWVRGIGGFLIYVGRLGESSYRVCICSVERVAAQFSVKKSSIDARMSQAEAFRLVEKLGARPCRIVKNKLVNGSALLSEASRELSYQDFVDSVRGMGLRVQLSP